MKPKEFEVIYKLTGAPTVPFPSASNWNIEAIGVLIRCKDCKHHKDEELGMVYCPNIVGGWVEEDGYCSWAERRGEE